MEPNIVIFGTGKFAKHALEEIDKSSIFAFIDNSVDKIGTEFHGKKVYSLNSLNELVKLHEYKIYIASTYYNDISTQLKAYELIEDIHFEDVAKLLSINKVREIYNVDADIEDEFISIYIKTKRYTLTSIERMYALYQSVKYIVLNDISGAFVECGVWRGGSAMVIAETLSHLKCYTYDLYLYDTFEGMTEPEDVDVNLVGELAHQKWSESQKGAINTWCYASLEDVKENLLKTNYPLNKVKFIKGKVEDTIPDTIPSEIALLRLDTDWYSSTYHEMKYLYPLLVQRGILIVDDYGHWLGSAKAVNEYLSEEKINLLLNKIDYSGRLAIK